jgi:hypothetical protein
MIANAMPVAIRQYSIAVAPDSSRRNTRTVSIQHGDGAASARPFSSGAEPLDRYFRESVTQDVKTSGEAAGVEFIDDNGGGVGVRFREVRRERPRE